MRISDQAILEVAQEIEPFAEEIIDREGVLTAKNVTDLSRRHAKHTISSERSTLMALEYLCS